MFKKNILLFLILSFLPEVNCLDKDLVSHVKNSIKNANEGISSLTKEILSLEGMSSSKVRHLLNNICKLNNSNYLEIGTWKGSTFVSALFKNHSHIKEAFAIDNWSQVFLGSANVKSVFLNNVNKFLNKNNFKYLEKDCFNLNLSEIFKEPINIYFYDGEHTAEAQRLAFIYYNNIFADTFIAIVDDYNEKSVQEGTQKAFRELNYKIIFEQYLPSRFNCDTENWWNGIYIAVIKK